MGLSRTISKVDDNFSQKFQNLPTHCVFCGPTDGVPLGIGYQHRGQKKTGMMGLPDGPKSFKIGLAI